MEISHLYNSSLALKAEDVPFHVNVAGLHGSTHQGSPGHVAADGGKARRQSATCQSVDGELSILGRASGNHRHSGSCLGRGLGLC